MTASNIKDSICDIVDNIIAEEEHNIKMGSLADCKTDSECSPDICDTNRKKCFKYINHGGYAYPIDVFIRNMFEFDMDLTKPFEYMLKTLGMTDCISKIQVNDKGVDTSVQIYDETLESFYNKYSDEGSCKGFSIIDISIKFIDRGGSHANVILVENIKDFLIWNYYEPHGYDISMNINYINKIKEIGELCAKKAGKKFIFNNREGAQCPRGIQRLLKDYDSGYCLIFSYFWIWCVLNVIKRMTSYIPSNQWISYVEECVAGCIQAYPLLVYKRVISFAYDLYNNNKSSREGVKPSVSDKIPMDIDEYNERVSMPDIGKNRGKYEEQFAPYSSDNSGKDEEEEEERSDLPTNISSNKILSYIYDHLNKEDKNTLFKSVNYGMIKQIEHAYNTGVDIKELISQLKKANRKKEKNEPIDIPADVEKIVTTKKFNLTGSKALVKASEKGYLPVVKYLISKGLDIDKDEALIKASSKGHLDIIEYLIKHKADIHANKDKAFRVAIENGHLSVVKYLAENGVNIRALDNVLILATEMEHLSIIKYLLKNGVDIHIEDDEAFKVASSEGYFPIVQYLFERGANIHADNDYALRLASENGHFLVVKYLLENGANIHANGDEALKSAITYINEREDDEDDDDEEAKNIHINKYLSIIKYLLEKGANAREIDLSTIKDSQLKKLLINK